MWHEINCAMLVGIWKKERHLHKEKTSPNISAYRLIVVCAITYSECWLSIYEILLCIFLYFIGPITSWDNHLRIMINIIQFYHVTVLRLQNKVMFMKSKPGQTRILLKKKMSAKREQLNWGMRKIVASACLTWFNASR